MEIDLTQVIFGFMIAMLFMLFFKFAKPSSKPTYRRA